jgi:hypothetical protein
MANVNWTDYTKLHIAWHVFVNTYATYYLTTTHTIQPNRLQRLFGWKEKTITVRPNQTTLSDLVSQIMHKRALPINGVWYSVKIEKYQGGDDGN